MLKLPRRTLALAITLLLAGCGGGGVNNDDDAKRAYEGLDASIDKAIQLGFDGFNAASNANIPPQQAKGTKSGTIDISGQVDQGASSNKTMNLVETLTKYSDDGMLTYDSVAPGALSMKLSKIPTGTLDGTLTGAFTITGELMGTVTLNLAFSGSLEPVPTDMTKVQRKPGTTHITGTATSDFGVYQVDVTR
jgi:hypothetical protein